VKKLNKSRISLSEKLQLGIQTTSKAAPKIHSRHCLLLEW
jgi:hypothetical protein